MVVAATGLLGATSAAASNGAPARLAVTGLKATIALSNCSAALVRYPSSINTDQAMMLTNGHCYEGGMPGAGVVLQDVASTRTGSLQSDSGATLGTLQANRLLYATMTGNDVALYRLTATFASIQTQYGTTAMTIAAARPADGIALTIPSSYWDRVWNCTLNGFVPTLDEGEWVWHDSIRYNSGCTTIHGTSGSPIVNSATGQVVGINNTGNDDGAMCTLNNPCEVAADGTTTATKGQSYGQETYWFDTCLTAANAIDLSIPGCLLTKPAGTPPPIGNLLLNAGFESGAASWTGSAGPITSDAGRPAHTGSWKMWLGGNGVTTTENESQSVTIASTATAPKLSYWIRTDTAESGTTVYDTMKVQVVSGTTTSTLVTYSNVATSTTYSPKTFDLSAYKGKTISVKFLMSEDSALQTSFVVDDTAVTNN